MEKPSLMWLSFYNPETKTHLGTAIVRASNVERGLLRAAELGIRPEGDCLSQGLSAASLPYYEAHLDTLMDDAELGRRFGDRNVLLADGQTPMSELPSIIANAMIGTARQPVTSHRAPYETPAIEEPREFVRVDPQIDPFDTRPELHGASDGQAWDVAPTMEAKARLMGDAGDDLHVPDLPFHEI